MLVQKFVDIKRDMTYEVGDFLGGGEENDVIKGMEIIDHILHVYTSSQEFTYPLKGGEWAKFTDGTSITFDPEDDDTSDDAGTE